MKRKFYVNRCGRDKKEIIASRVGVKAPARFLCMTEENSVSGITEVTHPEANPFHNFGLVIAAFNNSIRPRDIHRIEDLVKPVAICLCTIVNSGKSMTSTASNQLTIPRLPSVEDLERMTVSICKSWSDLKKKRQAVSLFVSRTWVS